MMLCCYYAALTVCWDVISICIYMVISSPWLYIYQDLGIIRVPITFNRGYMM